MPLGEEFELALRAFNPQEMSRWFFRDFEATM